MKCLFVCLILTCFLTGCYYDDGNAVSPSEYVRLRESQFHHYRPIHRQYKDWTAAESGKTMTLTADGMHIRLSVRSNPARIVIRKNGTIIGSVEKSPDGAVFVPTLPSSVPVPSLFCRESRKMHLMSGKHAFTLVFDENSAASNKLQVNRIHGHRYSISDIVPAASNETCKGTEIESPFSAAGTLIFYDEEVELPIRMGFAWFVTRFDNECLH